jgi:hypothetical protein
VSRKFDHHLAVGSDVQGFTEANSRVCCACSFDIFSTSLVCEMKPDAEGLLSECTVQPSMWLNATQRTLIPDLVRYRRYTEDAISQLTIVGTFANVSAAMEDLQYRPDADSNSMRLRSRLFSAKSAKEKPFETMTIDLEWLRSGNK